YGDPSLQEPRKPARASKATKGEKQDAVPVLPKADLNDIDFEKKLEESLKDL
ncbi:hypothetical protein EVA_10406, partial [gut metagenome]